MSTYTPVALELRRALVDSRVLRSRKDRAIRQVFDDFINGLRDDEDVSMTIDDNAVEQQWALSLFCRPSNQETAVRQSLQHTPNKFTF